MTLIPALPPGTEFGAFIEEFWRRYPYKRLPRDARERLLSALGHAEAIEEQEAKTVEAIFYVHAEHFTQQELRRAADLCDRKHTRLRSGLVAAIAHAEIFDLDEIVYRWRAQEGGNEAYLEAVLKYEERKRLGLRIPLDTALLALETTKNVAPRTREEIDYIVRQVLSQYPGPPKESEFKKWLKARWGELNPYPAIGSRKPRWIQSPEWPSSRSGRPMVFLGQLNIKGSDLFHDNASVYVFADRDQGEFKVVVQVY